MKYKGIKKKMKSFLHSNFYLNKNIFVKKKEYNYLPDLEPKIIKKFIVNDDFLEENYKNKLFLLNLDSYKTTRHKAQLPCRGQRTRTNSRTARKLKTL